MFDPAIIWSDPVVFLTFVIMLLSIVVAPFAIRDHHRRIQAARSAQADQEPPRWVQALLDDSPHGGWFYPFKIDEDHPLLEHSCFTCEVQLEVTDVVFVTPFERKWVATHRACMAHELGLSLPSSTMFA